MDHESPVNLFQQEHPGHHVGKGQVRKLQTAVGPLHELFPGSKAARNHEYEMPRIPAPYEFPGKFF